MTITGGNPAAGGSTPNEDTVALPARDPFAEIAALLEPQSGPADIALTDVGMAASDDLVGAAPSPPKKRGRPRKVPSEAQAGAAPSDTGRGSRRRPPQRDAIMAIVERDCRLWHAPDGESFASFTDGDHIDHEPVRSLAFRRFLCNQVYEATSEVPGAQAVEDAIRVCEAKAHKGPERAAWMRVGERAGHLFLDLADRRRSYAEVAPYGWQIRDGDGDAPFIRSSAMRPLCEPTDPGLSPGIDSLRSFVNVATDEDFVLTVAWLLAALRAGVQFPILAINGQQGSGKTTFTRTLRYLVDPNAAPVRAAPKDCRDLIVAASNCHVQAYDNLSRIDPDMSDALCRLSSGGGFSTRQLNTDRNEMLFFGSRPVILNGIPSLAERADLADRCIGIRLVRIEEDSRRTEAELWRDFEAAAPDILGALLDAMAAGLRELPTTKLSRPPRLADFATWVTACESGLGWAPGTFMRAFEENRRDVNASAFEADTIAVAVRDMLRDEYAHGWEGTPTALLAILNSRVSDDVRKARSWPFSAQALGGRVDRAAPLLRAQGIIVERRHSGARFIVITHAETAPHDTGEQSHETT